MPAKGNRTKKKLDEPREDEEGAAQAPPRPLAQGEGQVQHQG